MSSESLCPRSERRLTFLNASKSIAEMHFKRHSESMSHETGTPRKEISLCSKIPPPFSFSHYLLLTYFILMRVPWKIEECERKKRHWCQERYWMCSEVSIMTRGIRLVKAKSETIFPPLPRWSIYLCIYLSALFIKKTTTSQKTCNVETEGIKAKNSGLHTV